MSEADRTAKCADSFFHPVSHYDSPKLLNTQLTDIERNFIQRRLAEELQA